MAESSPPVEAMGNAHSRALSETQPAGSSLTAPVEEALESKYQLLQTLGVGAFGRALLAERRADGMQVVVKQIVLNDGAMRTAALQEARLLAQFDHVNIVRYLDCVLEGSTLNIVMEHGAAGDLASLIAHHAAEKRPFSEDNIMMWFVQILLAVHHLHSRKVLHRDLKSQNVFIAANGLLKLGDLGIARVLSDSSQFARTVVGTPFYLSPELCEDKPYNEKSDVWALGCLLYELASLRRAFNGSNLPALVMMILRGRYPPLPARYSPSLRGLVESLLRVNPRDRPSTDSLLRASYVRRHVERYALHVMQLTPVQPQGLLEDLLKSAASSKPATPTRPAGSADAKGRPPPSPPTRAAVATPPGRTDSANWARRQQAQLDELESALAAQAQGPAHRRQASDVQPGPQQDEVQARGADAVRQPGGPEPGLPDQPPRPGAAAAPAIRRSPKSAGLKVSPSHLSASPSAAAALKGATRQSEAEVARQAVVQERARKAEAQAKRAKQSEQATAQRSAERAREAERMAQEARAREADRVARAAELAAQLRTKEESKARLQEQLAAHMAAHQQQVKAAKARLNREQLAALGAQFLEKQKQAADSADPGLLVVVDAPAAAVAPPSDAGRDVAGPSAAQHGAGAPAACRTSPGQLKAGVPPWRQAPRSTQPTFPEVQIFTPFSGTPGSKAMPVPETDTMPTQPPPLVAAQPAPADPRGRSDPTPDAPPEQRKRWQRPEQDEARVVPPPASGSALPCALQTASTLESSELLGLLGELQAVLVGADSDEDRGAHDEEAAEEKRALAATTQGVTTLVDNAPASSGAADGLDMPSQQHVEELRVSLERDLGTQLFLDAYRCCREQWQDVPDANQETEAAQAHLLSMLTGRWHLVARLHRLISWEEAAFQN